MKIYLEAPNYHAPGQFQKRNGDGAESIFLSGSITGAEDWQTEATHILLPHFDIINPRRKGVVHLDPKEERVQIPWEHFYLNLSDIILFNFRPETLAPITLFEYGKMLEKTKRTWQRLYVCVHPDYERKNDIYIQTELENPELAKNIFDNLEKMCQTIIQEN